MSLCGAHYNPSESTAARASCLLLTRWHNTPRDGAPTVDSAEPQKEPTINRRATTLIAALILLVAAFLRLGAFQEALVGADQSSILASAADIAALRDFPLVGMKSSVGVMQTAAVAYLAALPLLLVHRVIAIRWFFSVIDLLALAFLYRAVGRTFGRRAGLIAALLVATSPWLIEFNRWIWYQTLISTFATIAFSALLLTLRNRTSDRPALIALAMCAATLMGLVHLASLPWAAVLWLLALAVVWRRRWWGAAAAGALASLTIAAPYANFLIRSHFTDVVTILADGASEGSTWNWSTYRLTLELLTGRQVLETPHNPLWSQSVLHADALMSVIPVLLIAAVVVALWQIATDAGRRRAYLFVLAWSVLAPTLFLRSGVHLQHFYLLFVFPAPYVLIAAALGRGLRQTSGASPSLLVPFRALGPETPKVSARVGQFDPEDSLSRCARRRAVALRVVDVALGRAHRLRAAGHAARDDAGVADG